MQGKEKAAVNPEKVKDEAQLQKELDKKAQAALRLDGIPAVFHYAGGDQRH